MLTAEVPQGRRQDRAVRVMLRLADGFAASVEGEPLRLSNRKARALLAYLALGGDAGATRERLAGLLWGDVGERQARASLRQTLAELRGALAEAGPDVCLATRDTVALAAGAVQTDIALIPEEIARGRLPEALRGGRSPGETLLAGLEDISPLFQDWLVATRHAVGLQAMAALRDGITDAGMAPEARRALAEALLRLDPLHEEACRTVMRLSAESGETGAALRAYAALYERLGAEMDMEPSLATQELVAAIKSGAFMPAVNPVPSSSPSTFPSAFPSASSLASSPPMQAAAARRSVLAAGGTPVVAVLPFRVAPPADALFGDGMAEDIVGTLAMLREPVVISANSTRRFRATEETPSVIAAQLGAEYLVFGSLRAAGDGARIAVELVEAQSGAVLWARGYEASLSRLFETQAEIAASVAAALVPRIADAELRMSQRRAPEDMQAYHLLLQAREMMFRLDEAALAEAEGLLRRAIALEPRGAGIHAAIAEWHTLRLFQGWSPDPAADARALDAAGREALRLDPQHSRALAMCGHNLMLTTRRHDQALEMLGRAADLAPNDPDTLIWSVPTLAYAGRTDEAVRRAERAIALSPADPCLFRNEHFRSIAHYAAGDFEQAALWGRRAAERNANYTSNLRTTVAALSGLGRMDEARSLAQRLMSLQPGIRVGDIVARQVFRDDRQGRQYGEHMLAAGLPA